jgi:(2Fe-2S) ferredoxin
MTSRLAPGSLVYVRYQDHVLFRNVDPETAKPIVQEAWGRLEYEDQEYVRLVVARYQEPNNDGKATRKATGLVILKTTILEMRRIA